MKRAFVAMSGGVDSSVAAALLVQQGYDVTGVTMRLRPCSDASGKRVQADAADDARRVCDQLGIAHRTLDLVELFEKEVIGPYASEYLAGRTPNPCVRCNDRLKFGALLDWSVAQGAELLATGHYARIVRAKQRLAVARAVDDAKDQSYFLYRLTDRQLRHVVLPLGERTKEDVRKAAREMGLVVHDRAESQDVCFAQGGIDDVIAVHGADMLAAGPIEDLAGSVVGTHTGLAHYTVGQRRGLRIGGLDRPLHVIRLDAERNVLIVGPRESLAVHRVHATEVVWSAGDEPFDVRVQTRYRMRPVKGRASRGSDGLEVELADPVFGVSPGQAVVCYAGDVVIGGGTIERTA